MNRDGSDRIREVFAAKARDVTPAPLRAALCVLYAPVSRDPDMGRHCVSVLSDSELHRANRFVREADKNQFRQRRAFRRFCGVTALGSSQPLSQIIFEQTENGRPFLRDAPDTWFSFSSCSSGFLGAWSSTHGVGVDLEDPTRNLEAVELANQFFSRTEAKAIAREDGQERLRIFFQFWSLKEAALKSIGEGLPFGLDAFQFELKPGLRIIHAPPGHGGAEQFDAHLIEGTGRCAALVTRSLA